MLLQVLEAAVVGMAVLPTVVMRTVLDIVEAAGMIANQGE